MKDKLDKAIAEFENEKSNLTLGERISGLRQALIWDAFAAFKINKEGGKVTDEMDLKHNECMKYLNQIEKMYLSELKTNKATGKGSINDKDWVRKFKESNSSLGSIVRNMNEEKTA